MSRSFKHSLPRSLLLLIALLAACHHARERDDTGDDADVALDASAAPNTSFEEDADALSDASPEQSLDGAPDAGGEAGMDDPTAPSDGGASEPRASDSATAMDGDAALEASVADAGDGRVCMGEETCNGLDDDCDGVADEGCPASSFQVRDFDVRGSGASVAVGVQGNRIMMGCLRADRTVARAAFQVAGPDSDHKLNDGSEAKVADVQVAQSRTLGNVVVTYSYWNFPDSPSDWRVYAAFYDHDCVLLKAPQRLATDISPAVGYVRPATPAMTNDGRAILMYEHQSAGRFRVPFFNAAGERTTTLDIPTGSTATTCGGGARTGVLALDPTSGKFAVVCESGLAWDNSRIYRRYTADGTPIDPAFTMVPDSTATFPFHYFGAGLNGAGTLLYFGRTSPTTWIIRSIAADGSVARPAAITGSLGRLAPRSRVTSQGSFLIELEAADYGIALVSADGEVQRGWPSTGLNYRLDDTDVVYELISNDVARSPTVTLR